MPQLRLAQHFRSVTNLALAGQEHQHVTRAFALAALMGGNLVEGGENCLVNREVVLDAVALLVLFAGQWPVPGFHRIGAARDFDDWRVVEVLGETLQINRRRGNDYLEVRAPRQQGFQITEQEVDVQAALVSFVDDDGVVALEKTVVLGFGQENTVGHQLDQGIGVALVFKTHLVTDQRPQWRAQFFGHPGGNTARRDPPRLGVSNQTMLATPQLQADFRQLGGFTRAGFPGNDQHLMRGEDFFDFVTLGGNRQAVVVTNARHAGLARSDLGTGRLDLVDPLGQLRLVRALAQFMQLPAQAMALGNHGVVEVFQQLIDSVVSHGGFLVVQVSLLFHDRHRKGCDCRRFAPARHGCG
ncbi:hypothetical protein D3C81_751460 [compost metagenome]